MIAELKLIKVYYSGEDKLKQDELAERWDLLEEKLDTYYALLEYAAQRGLTNLLKPLLKKVSHPKELIDKSEA